MPVSLAEIATITHHDEALAKLDAKPRDLLVAADLAYTAGLADEKKWPAARAAYEVALAAPGVGDLEGYARFRLARVMLFQRDAASIAELAKIVTLDGAPGPGARALAQLARDELVTVYARLGDPSRAFDQLRLSASEGTSSDADALARVEEVAREARRLGEHGSVAALLQKIAARAPASESGCQNAVGRTEALLARVEDPGREAAAIEELFGVAREFRESTFSTDAKRACDAAVVALATDAATRWHVEAVGARGARGSSAPVGLRIAQTTYELILANFAPAELDAMTLPGPGSAAPHASRTRPTAFRLRRAIGDLLYFAMDWKRAAAAYDEALALEPNTPDAVELTYRASAARTRALHETHEVLSVPIEPGPETELTAEDVVRVEADNRLLCLGEPPRSSPGYFDWVDAKLDRGIVSASHRRWPDAARDLREVAFHHPDHAGAARAGLLYIKILELSTPSRPTCGAELSTAAPSLFELACSMNADQIDWVDGGLALRMPGRRKTCDSLRALVPSHVPDAIIPELPPLPPDPSVSPAPRLRGGDRTVVSGRIPIEVFEHVVEGSLGGALGCYEIGLRADPALEGQLRARLVIGPDGSVRKVEMRASDALVSSKVSTCVTRWFYGLVFPPPEGGVVKLDYPLGLTRTRLIPPQPESPVTMTVGDGD